MSHKKSCLFVTSIFLLANLLSSVKIEEMSVEDKVLRQQSYILSWIKGDIFDISKSYLKLGKTIIEDPSIEIKITLDNNYIFRSLFNSYKGIT